MFRLTPLACALLLALPAYATEAPQADAKGNLIDNAPTTEQTTEQLAIQGIRGLNREDFDPDVSACDDFYLHVNGGWLKRNPIPADQALWGSFSILGEQNTARVRAIAEDARTAVKDGKARTGTPMQQIGDFYSSMLDTATIEARGVAAIQSKLDQIDAIEDAAGVARYVMQRYAVADNTLFGFGIGPDLKNSSMNFVYASQGGLGLPNKTYYEPTDDVGRETVKAYQQHISNILVLGGASREDADAMAARIYAIEERIARASLAPVELRDPSRRYNPLSIEDAKKLTPNFDWQAFIDTLKIAPEQISIAPVGYFEEINQMIAEVPAAEWREYFRWQALRSASPFLSQAFVDENFAFYQQRLAGAKVQPPRWRRAIDLTNGLLGEPMGQLYVERHFPAEAKAKMGELISDLKTALKARLEKLEWMGEDTRKEALAKFASFTPKIGYPEEWRDYSSVVVKADDLIGNIERLRAFEQAEDLAKVGKPVDRKEWRMSPQTVNAYYNPTMNEIVFPAGILQPPFFDFEADPALNYGAIGAVIGHELLHGFDDSGSRFDAQGNMRNWWTEEDRKRFEERTGRLVNQYNAYRTVGLNLNGKLSLGENIADLGGITVAYDALKARLAREPVGEIDGLTQEQRFFAAWSQVWRVNMRQERLRLQVQNGPHAPGQFRGKGPLVNVPAFAEAWGCKAGDPMVAGDEERVAIW